MTTYRGGNSRTLAKSFDELERPLAVLDYRGEILFASASLCEMAGADATQLVGKRCSWEMAEDDSPFAPILTALAPPARALEGEFVARHLTAPIVFGSTATGQLFLPIRDRSGTLSLIVVILGDWEETRSQWPQPPSDMLRRRASDEVLVRLRSQWSSLESLVPLLGESPAIKLAMQRAQLAIQTDGSVLVSGPRFIGKQDVLRGIFAGRLRRLQLQKVAGQLFPIDCSVQEEPLLLGMLEVFAGRIRANLPIAAQQLVLERIDTAPASALPGFIAWLKEYAASCCVTATSEVAGGQLAERSSLWNQLVAHLASIEIQLPPLSKRREDIPVLASQMLAAQCHKQDRSLLSISAEVSDLLSAYSWPENLTELQRAVGDMVRLAVLSSSVQSQHLPVAIRTFGSSSTTSVNVESIDLDSVLEELERTIIARAIRLSPRNRAQVARWLGISRPRLLRRLEQLGLNSSADESADLEDENE